MTEKEAKATSAEEARNLPWDHDCMVFTEGRFYLGIWNMPIPESKDYPKGGDLLLQVWRYDDQPDNWILTGRIRKKVDEKIFGSSDRKRWFAARSHAGTEEQMLKLVKSFFDDVSGFAGLMTVTAPPHADELLFRGDAGKALDIIMAAKLPWMHMKTERVKR